MIVRFATRRLAERGSMDGHVGTKTTNPAERKAHA
jgi:hypothetical protein